MLGGRHLVVALSLLLLEAVVLSGVVARLATAAGTGNGGGVVEEHGTELAGIGRLALGAQNTRADVWNVDRHLRSHVAGHDAHDNSAGAVSALVLAEVVAAAELLATVGALERLVMSVERTVVALEVFLATEATGAESADKGLGGILSQRLLATAAGGRGRGARVRVVIARGGARGRRCGSVAGNRLRLVVGRLRCGAVLRSLDDPLVGRATDRSHVDDGTRGKGEL